MAACSGGELELKWAAEKNALRHECYLELKHKLLDVAQAQLIAQNESQKTLHQALGDETLLDLKQKLDAIALSGRQLSHVFMNTLVATSVHRIASAIIHSRKKPTQDLVTEESRTTRDNDADFHPTSGCDLAMSSAAALRITPHTSNCFPDSSSRYPSLSRIPAVVEEECAQARTGGGAGLALEGFPIDRVLKPLQDVTRGYPAKTQLARLVQERIDLERQMYNQRNLLAKRSAYLRDCRVAAKKEKEVAQMELAAAMLSLVMAEKERVAAADCRAAALEELKHTTPLKERSQPKAICCTRLGLQDVKAPEKILGSAPTASAEAPQVHLSIPPCVSLPLSTCPAILTLTPPDPPDETESNGHSVSVITTTSGVKPICPKVATEPDGNFDERRDSTSVSHSGVKEVVNVAGTVENPIGSYVRPPMPLENMLKCVRCLFGKDKSLKTGNRARAFLGVPWSQIVSFDPDVLLRRGVLGIKEGSTGMASRLRMMTIIESALSNQNDDTIPAEVWERPTHFCENCQKRYPITVSSNEAVLSFEEFAQREKDLLSQAPVEGKPKTQETINVKGKRNRKRSRGTRSATHPPC